MTQTPATKHLTPVPESRTQLSEERDTLNDTPELRFLRDEIEALLGAASVRSLNVPVITYPEEEQPIDPEQQSELRPAPWRPTEEADSSIYERDTEPSLDVQLLREAAKAAGK